MSDTTPFIEFVRRSTFACGWADLDGNIVFANPALGRLLDLEPEDLNGTDVSLYYPNELRAKLRQIILPAVRHTGEWVGELPLRSAKGKVTHCVQNIFLIRDENNAPQFFANIITDISELKEHEQRLSVAQQELHDANRRLVAAVANAEAHEQAMRAERDRARKYFDLAAVIFLELDRYGNVAAINPEGCRVLGCGRAETLGSNWFDNFIPERIRNEIRGVFDSLVAGTIDPVEHYENPVLTRNGAELTIHWSNTVLHDTEGNVTGTLSCGEDITARRLAEACLRESEQRYRLVFEGAAEGIIVANIETRRFLHANPAICEMLGYTRDEIVNLSVLDVHPPDSHDRVIAEFEAQARGEKRLAQELPCRRKDGSIFYADILTSPIMLGGARCNVGFFNDVTNRRDAARQREQLVQADKLASLGTLVAGVGHEINNPNSFIMLNAANLQDLWDDMLPVLEQYCKEHNTTTIGMSQLADFREAGPEFLKLILEGSERIKNIVKELKTFAREDNAAMNAPIALNRVATSAVALVGNRLKNSTNSFSVDYANDIPVVVGNYQRLEQVVVNLLLNACDALPERSRAIQLSTEYDHSNETAVLKVRDEGDGMSPCTLKHVTDPFFTTKRESGGTGLGLAISAKVIEEHGGALAFASSPGEGTTATISLPVPDRVPGASAS